MSVQYRQGDVLIIGVDGLPDELRELERNADGRLVLADGELTGHAHVVLDEDARLYERNHGGSLDDRFLRVLAEGGVDLTHEEHWAVRVPRGTYIVRRQREYVPPLRPAPGASGSWRAVTD